MPQADDRAIELQARVKALERQLGIALGTIDKLKFQQQQQQQQQQTSNVVLVHQDADQDGHQDGAQIDPALSNTRAEMYMPPMHEALSVARKYLSTWNSIMPLFDPQATLQSIRDWYQHPHLRDTTTWALLSVVLALGEHMNGRCGAKMQRKTAVYVSRAQSVLTNLLLGPASLSTVQIVVGLALMFQANIDFKPAAILIATGLHLAHSLGLHREGLVTDWGVPPVDSATAKQQTRVFWVAYIVDRELSMQSSHVPIQRDNDIGCALPPLTIPAQPGEPDADADQTGFFFPGGHDSFIKDGITQAPPPPPFSYFRAHVQLAQVQGQIYDLMRSVAGQMSSNEERAQGISAMTGLMDSCAGHVPIPPAGQKQPVWQLKALGLFYTRRIWCRVALSQASLWDAQWMGKLESLASGKEAAAAIQGPGTACEYVGALPLAWAPLVEDARRLVSLVVNAVDHGCEEHDAEERAGEEDDDDDNSSFFTMVKCPLLSSAAALAAHATFAPQHVLLYHDRLMVSRSLRLLEAASEERYHEVIHKTIDLCGRLFPAELE
jgi:hypothetical protein